ncbi:MAG: DUF3007 family protein [Synechococcaceae cyanobacterium]|nr:DUF3007 family protein [Synechococcaceae cyanobacterium]
MTRGQAILVGLAVLGLGGLGYAGFRASGLEGFSAGISASVVLMLIVAGWTASYLLRVVSGRMTYMEQRRRYRDAYDAATDDALQARFDSLSPEEQTRLLAEVGQLRADAEM